MRNDPSNVCGVTAPPPSPQGKNDRAEGGRDSMTFFQPFSNPQKRKRNSKRKRTPSLFLCSTRQQFDRITELCHRKFSFSGKIRENHTRVLFAKYLFSRHIYFLAGKKGGNPFAALSLSLSAKATLTFFRSSSVGISGTDRSSPTSSSNPPSPPTRPPPPPPPVPKSLESRLTFFSSPPRDSLHAQGRRSKRFSNVVLLLDTLCSDQRERAAEYLPETRGASSVEFSPQSRFFRIRFFYNRTYYRLKDFFLAFKLRSSSLVGN